MKSYDIVGYVMDGQIYCMDCMNKGDDPEEVAEDEELDPIFADSEWDSYPTCNECLCTIEDVNLTNYGRQRNA